jgi:hypothetical protein
MSVISVLTTDGFIACGMIKAPDGESIVLAASGGGGHIYSLDLTSNQLLDRGTLGAPDWHSFNMTPDGTLEFGTSPASDEVVVIDLATQPVTNRGTLHLAALPGVGANQPDALGGGDPIVDGVLPVSLRAAGQLALVDVASLGIQLGCPYHRMPPESGASNGSDRRRRSRAPDGKRQHDPERHEPRENRYGRDTPARGSCLRGQTLHPFSGRDEPALPEVRSATLHHPGCYLGSRVEAELAPDLLDMKLRCPLGNDELVGDRSIGQAFADERRDLPLSGRERHVTYSTCLACLRGLY